MTDRTPIARVVDWSAAKDRDMQHAIQAFVTRRIDPVSLRTIQRWFAATPPEFVAERVDAAVQSGKISMRRNGLSKRAGYVYQASHYGVDGTVNGKVIA